MRRFILCVLICLSFLTGNAWGKEITILYTQGVRASLYPNRNLNSPVGGVSRRATLIHQWRRRNPQMILIEGGDAFGGGLQDKMASRPSLDALRTLAYINILQKMNYDALIPGDAEFNFGVKFLEDIVRESSLNFVSCNIHLQGFEPYLIKEIGNIKVGILGVMKPLTEIKGSVFSKPEQSLRKAVRELKDQETDLILLISSLGEQADKKIAQDIKGIDAILTRTALLGQSNIKKKGGAFLIPFLPGSNVIEEISLTVEKEKITHASVKMLSLDESVAPDDTIEALLPRCYSASDCQKEGFIGSCKYPGKLVSSCSFKEIVKIPVTVIVPQNCQTCHPQVVIDKLKVFFPGLTPQNLTDNDPKARKIMAQLNISMLPAYVFSPLIEREESFSQFNKLVKFISGQYYLKPEFSGVSYFSNRERKPNRLDVFLLMTSPQSPHILELLREVRRQKKDLDIRIQLIGREDKENAEFISPGGKREINEDTLYACVEKKEPAKAWEYLHCRLSNVNTLWWRDCLIKNNIDIKNVERCARGKEGKKEYGKRIQLAEDLMVFSPSVFLLNNKEIFGVTDQTGVDELLKVMNAANKD